MRVCNRCKKEYYSTLEIDNSVCLVCILEGPKPDYNSIKSNNTDECGGY